MNLTKTPSNIKQETNMNFTNKVAVVTGEGGGLGLAIIEKFDRGGAEIVALDYSQKMAYQNNPKIQNVFHD